MFNCFYARDNSFNVSQFILIFIVAMLPFFGGCGEDDNPIVDDHGHDNEADSPLHADVDGFILQIGDEEVYRQFQGTHSGNITVNVGQEIEVHAVFIDVNGDKAPLEKVKSKDEHGHVETFSLGLSGYDSAIIEIHLEREDAHADEENGEDAHADEENGGDLGFEIEGLNAGTTEIKLQLIHGGHPDYTAALLIPVTVE